MIQVRPQHVAPQLEVRELTLPGNFDKSRAFQFFEVVRECGRAHRLAFAYIGARRAALLRSDLPENFITPRIGERFGDQLQLFFCQSFPGMTLPLRHAGPQPS